MLLQNHRMSLSQWIVFSVFAVVMSQSAAELQAQTSSMSAGAFMSDEDLNVIRHTVLFLDNERIVQASRLNRLESQLTQLSTSLEQLSKKSDVAAKASTRQLQELDTQLKESIQSARQELQTTTERIESMNSKLEQLAKNQRKQSTFAVAEPAPAPPAESVEASITSYHPVLPELVASFQTRSGVLAQLFAENGKYVLEKTESSRTTRTPIAVTSQRPCRSCMDVSLTEKFSLSPTLTLVWHPCKKEYLLVSR